MSPRTEGARSQVAAMREVHTLAGGEIRLQLSDIHVQRTAKTERDRQEEMTYASKQYKNVYVGSSTSKILQQMSNITSCPSHRHGKHRRTTVRSVSSSKEGTHMTKLYGFTAEPGTSATRVVNQEILKASVVVHQFPRAVQDKVNDLLPDGVEFACEMLAASSFPEVGCLG